MIFAAGCQVPVIGKRAPIGALRSLVSGIVTTKLFVWRGLGKSARRVKVVQCSIDQQLAQHGQLLDRQHDIAARTFHFTRKVGGHDIQGRECFAGVTEQGLGVDVRNDGEHMADRIGTTRITQTCADKRLGDFAEPGYIDSLEG
jgi:hypothetical protein